MLTSAFERVEHLFWEQYNYCEREMSNQPTEPAAPAAPTEAPKPAEVVKPEIKDEAGKKHV